MSDDGSYIVTAQGSSERAANLPPTLRLWRGDTGGHIKTVDAHAGGVWSVAIPPDSRAVLSGGPDRTLKIWSLPDLTLLKTIEYGAGVSAIAVSPDGKFALVGHGSVIDILRMEDGINVGQISDHEGAVKKIAIAPDGSFIASGDLGVGVRMWKEAPQMAPPRGVERPRQGQ